MIEIHTEIERAGRFDDGNGADDPMTLYKKLRAEGKIQKPVKNFKRFDPLGKAFFLAALELISLVDERQWKPINTGLLVVDRDGALASNTIYFKNYLNSGRSMGSPNEFVYTLPTSICAEVGIYFGIMGQILYMSATVSDLHEFARRQAEHIICTGQHDHIFMFVNDTHRIKGVFITRQSGAESETSGR